MIKLHNLEKFFNRNKTNEIHVINDISLTLPKTGLVVLLGPSGSGKTTLLNVLGGLDRTQSGIIDFDGQQIKGYQSKTWDHIRNEHIGYVFQNYNLMYNQTVYDNIALSLRMVGITEKSEIDKRVDYLLGNMGMINYRRRKAAALSGGQQQRVAIARALAKNPKVIIADEPTGNLDSKNTFDIMNILRSISQTKLVVLVTHEENIAELYADRIIRLNDGKVVEDDLNKSVGGVDVQLETDIYLKDLNQITDFDSGQTKYKVYSDEDTDSTFEVKLIVKNKTLYVDVKSDKFKRINLLEKDSEVAVFDAHFKGQEIEEFSQTEFDLDSIVDDSTKTHGGSVISIKEAFRLGFGQFRSMSFMKIFRNVLFVSNAIIIGIALALLFNAYTSDNLDFITEPVNLVNVVRNSENYDDFMAFENQESIDFVDLTGKLSLTVVLPTIYQTQGNESSISSHIFPSHLLDEKALLLGRAPIAQNEIVLNKHHINNVMQNYIFESLGIQSLEDFLNLKLKYTIRDGSVNKEVFVEIVGITDEDDVMFYAHEETIWQIKSGMPVLELYEDDITIVKGALSDSYRQAVILDNDLFTEPLSAFPGIAVGTVDFGIEATFETTNDDVPNMLISLENLKEAQFSTDFKNTGGVVSIQTNDPDSAVTFLAQTFDRVEQPYIDNQITFSQVKLINSIPYIMFAGVFLGAAFLGTFFIMRSSLLSRIYEVSVYRALGAPKRDLRRIFLIEVFILTIFTSVIGYIAVSYVLYRLQIMTEGYFELVKITPLSFLAGIGVILIVNVFSGVLPVTNLLRRTPAEIISKYDF